MRSDIEMRPELFRAVCKDKAGIFRAMAHESRLILLCQLAQGEKSVSELELLLDMHQPNLSQQLKVLGIEGVVTARREGTRIFYSLADRDILALVETIYELWREHAES